MSKILLNDQIYKIIQDRNLNCSIKEFKNNASWFDVSATQYLSENFIREFKDQVNWDNISRYQKLSNNFILEFKNYLDLDSLLREKRITQIYYNYLINGKVKRYEILDI